MSTHSFRLGFLSHLEAHTDLRHLYRAFIELFRYAEELGFDTGWVAQHHFEDGRHGPGAGASPLTFLAAVAENTKRLRLGTAVVTLPLESPIRLAEEAATLDLISGGRLELGIGSGNGAKLFETFGVSLDDRRERTTEGINLLYRAYAGKPLHEGGPILQPQSPGLNQRIWQGIFSERGARYAAAAGSNLLLNRAAYGYSERTDLVQRPWGEAFLEAWDQNPANAGRRPRIGLSRLIYPAKDKETARAHLGAGIEQAARKMVASGRFPEGLSLDGYLERFNAFYGSPDEVIEQLSDEQCLPFATDVLCQVNPGVPDLDQIARTLELIATRVAPALGWKPEPAILPEAPEILRAGSTAWKDEEPALP
jgi:alkanesulfonate monooxygenase SsuD/methylene tetrahydromethanopterin reductase-like flavin-dependent oxidoreductase (luciferase family)